MPHLTLELFGSARITADGQHIDLRVRKELALLAYLAAEPGHPHRRDHLLGLLWPDVPEEAARNNLRVVLARLRRALGDAAGALQIDRQQAQLVPHDDAVVDVLAFRALLQAVRAHPHAAAESCDACVARLAEAVERYGGQRRGRSRSILLPHRAGAATPASFGDGGE